MLLRTLIVSAMTAAWALPVLGADATTELQGDDASGSSSADAELVTGSGKIAEVIEGIRTQQQFVMVRADAASHHSGVIQLVVVRLTESDRKCLQRLPRKPRGGGNDGAGIDSHFSNPPSPC